MHRIISFGNSYVNILFTLASTCYWDLIYDVHYRFNICFNTTDPRCEVAIKIRSHEVGLIDGTLTTILRLSCQATRIHVAVLLSVSVPVLSTYFMLASYAATFVFSYWRVLFYVTLYIWITVEIVNNFIFLMNTEV